MKNKYSVRIWNPSKVVKARGSDLRVRFKNTHEAAMVLKGMKLTQAQKYLNDVIHKRRAVPFRVFNGGAGRHAQAHEWSTSQCRWPKKSCEFLLSLLKNAESNAKEQKKNISLLRIVHIQVNQASKMRRRTYRAHGRINAYMSSPSHIEVVLRETYGKVPLPPPIQMCRGRPIRSEADLKKAAARIQETAKLKPKTVAQKNIAKEQLKRARRLKKAALKRDLKSKKEKREKTAKEFHEKRVATWNAASSSEKEAIRQANRQRRAQLKERRAKVQVKLQKEKERKEKKQALQKIFEEQDRQEQIKEGRRLKAERRAAKAQK